MKGSGWLPCRSAEASSLLVPKSLLRFVCYDPPNTDIQPTPHPSPITPVLPSISDHQLFQTETSPRPLTNPPHLIHPTPFSHGLLMEEQAGLLQDALGVVRQQTALMRKCLETPGKLMDALKCRCAIGNSSLEILEALTV